MPLKWIPRSKSGASKSRPRWAAHTCIGNVWEYPPDQRALSNKTYKEGFIVKLVLTVLETLRRNGELKSL